MTKQKRSTIAHFINSTPDETAATYELLGVGIMSLEMSYNPNVVSETPIHQDTASTSVESYAPTIPLEQYIEPGDDAFDYIDSLRQAGPATFGDAETDIVEVRKYETPDTPGTTYPATQWPCCIAIDKIGGDGGGSGKIGFTVHINGDPVDGTFNVNTLAFTPAS